MKSNEDYLDELLKSMGEDSNDEFALMESGAELELEKEVKTASPIMDTGMGMMDQAMIDALLAGAAGESVVDGTVSEDVSAEESFGEAQLFDSAEDFEKALMAELEEENIAKIEEISNADNIENIYNFENIDSSENMTN